MCLVCRHVLYNLRKGTKLFPRLFTKSFYVCIKLSFIINMNTKTFLDFVLLITSPLSSIFLFSLLEWRIRWHLPEFIFLSLSGNYSNSFSANIWSLLRSTSMFLSQKYVLLSSAHAAKVTCVCSKNMSNVFIFKSKGPSMDPWDAPFSIFDHVLKDEFILVFCSRPTN